MNISVFLEGTVVFEIPWSVAAEETVAKCSVVAEAKALGFPVVCEAS